MVFILAAGAAVKRMTFGYPKPSTSYLQVPGGEVCHVNLERLAGWFSDPRLACIRRPCRLFFHLHVQVQGRHVSDPKPLSVNSAG
jgi:hypothetical protein